MVEPWDWEEFREILGVKKNKILKVYLLKGTIRHSRIILVDYFLFLTRGL